MNNQKKTAVLVVDKDPQIQKMIRLILEQEDFKIIECNSGKQAIRLSLSIKPDIILLDLNPADISGKEVIEAIREWSQIPIIALSIDASDDELVMALHAGANDYMAKPFNIEVLLARIQASIRTSATHEAGEPELVNGPLRIDLVRHEVFLDNKLCSFTPKEYDLLKYFMINRGKMLTHKEILKKVWGVAHGDDVTYLRVYIGQIREKIEKTPTLPVFIKTEPSIGYRMEILPNSTL